MTLADCPVHWVSKLQVETALSTLESEYIALAQAMRELVPMRHLLLEIISHVDLKALPEATSFKSVVWEDNNGCIATVKAPKLTPCTKHIAIKYHYSKSQIGEDKGIILEKIESLIQKADILTKGLGQIDFERIRGLMCGW